MRIRLVRKLADAIDGVDISEYVVGDVIDLNSDEARLLIAEGWAVSTGRRSHRPEMRLSSRRIEMGTAADSSRRRVRNQLRRASEQIEQRGRQLPHGRRREDALVDELHDACAKTIRHDA
jgi:hypothetical protein